MQKRSRRSLQLMKMTHAVPAFITHRHERAAAAAGADRLSSHGDGIDRPAATSVRGTLCGE